MFDKYFSKVLVVLVFVSIFPFIVASNCGVKYTGGGTIPSRADNGKKANFGFVLNSCYADRETGEGTISNVMFHDKWAEGYGKNGVMLRGWVIDARECGYYSGGDCKDCNSHYRDIQDVCPDTLFFRFAGRIAYTSQNPKVADTMDVEDQQALICLTDKGEGANDPADIGAILVESGPFEGYMNCNYVSGNIQEHECEDD